MEAFHYLLSVRSQSVRMVKKILLVMQVGKELKYPDSKWRRMAYSPLDLCDYQLEVEPKISRLA